MRAEKVERIGLPTASTAQSNDFTEGGTVASALRRDSVFHNLHRSLGASNQEIPPDMIIKILDT